MTSATERPTTVAVAAREAPAFPDARILIVDDEPANVAVLCRILERAGYHALTGTSSPAEGLRLAEDGRPDLILLDQHMRELDGLALLQRLRPRLAADEFVPVVFLSGDTSAELRRRALRAGATDFIGKPFDPIEVVLRIGILLETRRLHLLQAAHAVELERRVRERTAQVLGGQREMFERLCRVAAYRDDDTGLHTRRVGRIAHAVALSLGIPPAEAELIGAAAELHDLGKVGVPDDILRKPGRLTDEETAVMRTHAQIGARSLSGSMSPLLQLAESIARWHHERWDGAGYPDALAGEAIPLEARLVAVADVADALAHDRPYRQAWPLARVIEEIRRQAGRQFDPRVVRAWLSVVERDAGALAADDDAGLGGA